MKTSIVYIQVRCIVQHGDELLPEDVINEADCAVRSPNVITSSVEEVDVRGECHPTEHYLLR